MHIVKSQSIFSLPSHLGLPDQTHGFRPTEDLLDALALSLTDRAALVAGRSAVHRLAAFSLGNVQRDIESPSSSAKARTL
jgi:hypothetical protein